MINEKYKALANKKIKRNRCVLNKGIVNKIAAEINIEPVIIRQVMYSMNAIANVAVSENVNFYVSNYMKFKISKVALERYKKKHSK